MCHLGPRLGKRSALESRLSGPAGTHGLVGRVTGVVRPSCCLTV